MRVVVIFCSVINIFFVVYGYFVYKEPQAYLAMMGVTGWICALLLQIDNYKKWSKRKNPQ